MNNYITITRADILSLTSTRYDRITLPIKPQTADVLFFAEAMIAEVTPTTGYPDTDEGAARYIADCLRVLDESKISATVTLTPQHKRISASVDLAVVTPDGQHLQRRYVCRVSEDDATKIIKDFFAEGAAGLREDFHEYFQRRYTEHNGNTAA